MTKEQKLFGIRAWLAFSSNANKFTIKATFALIMESVGGRIPYSQAYEVARDMHGKRGSFSRNSGEYLAYRLAREGIACLNREADRRREFLGNAGME